MKTDIRLLDIDDMVLMDYLLHGRKVCHAARLMGLSPPALSHRLRKMEGVFGIESMIEVFSDGARLRQEALPCATKLSIALFFLTERNHGRSKSKTNA